MTTIKGDYRKALKLLVAVSGMTQRELAEEVGVTLNYVNLVLNGHRHPTLGTLRKIAGALGFTLSLKFVEPNKRRKKPC